MQTEVSIKLETGFKSGLIYSLKTPTCFLTGSDAHVRLFQFLPMNMSLTASCISKQAKQHVACSKNCSPWFQFYLLQPI